VSTHEPDPEREPTVPEPEPDQPGTLPGEEPGMTPPEPGTLPEEPDLNPPDLEREDLTFAQAAKVGGARTGTGQLTVNTSPFVSGVPGNSSSSPVSRAA
jgi:hypothetical protein